MSNRLSRVHWTMGQALLPEHLYALEESMLADSFSRFNLHGLPSYGLSRLRWNEALLAQGMLSLEEMSLVLPSGLLLVLKKNARITTLNLDISGASVLSVYVHLRSLPENQEDSIARVAVIRDNVNCWMWSLSLSTEQENQDTLDSFHLLDFEKQPNGAWQLSSRYIPPLLCLGTVPFLKEELQTLLHKLEAYHYHLAQEITAIYLSGSDFASVKQSQKNVTQLLRFLGNLFGEISPHPYYVYEQLKSFYVELCCYHNKEPEFATSVYRHLQLVEVFKEIISPLQEQLQFTQSRSPYLPFQFIDNLIQTKLPVTIREAKEIYFLVQKSSIHKEVSLEGMKIAAVSRIAVLHKFYLQGIPIKQLDRPPFQHSFGPEVDIYQLNHGEEWDYALQELTLGFYADPKFLTEKFFLYWRNN